MGDSWPVIEAHRGDSRNAPENTLAAFTRATACGAKWLELDVHVTRDGRFAVIHDAALERTTDGTGNVSEQDWQVLSRLDAGRRRGQEFAGEGIPALEDVVELARRTGVRLNVEVKGRVPDDAVLARLVALVADGMSPPRHVLSSFTLELLLAVRWLAPDLVLGLIGSGPTALAQALRHGLPWIHVDRKTVCWDLVASAHAAGLGVHVWTVDDPSLYQHYRRMGVDRLCTNDPGPFIALRRTAASTGPANSG